MLPSIQLSSGRFFSFTDFAPEDINIRDIAHSLSMICRFTGHCKKFYSVAQHSVLVSTLVPEELALAGLLHDATEAYINDLSRPLKIITPQYVEFEHKKLWPAIAAAFDLPLELPRCIKDADNIALVTEKRDLMPKPIDADGEWEWAKEIPVMPNRIRPESQETAKRKFLARYRALTKGK